MTSIGNTRENARKVINSESMSALQKAISLGIESGLSNRSIKDILHEARSKVKY